MPFEVEYTDEFEQWWNTLDEDGQATVDAYVRMLEEFRSRARFSIFVRHQGVGIFPNEGIKTAA